MANIDDIIEDIRFGLGDIEVEGADPRYSNTMLLRRVGNSIALFNRHNSKEYTDNTLPSEYCDFIVILVQILLCRWEAARNAKKFKISLSNLNASINERVDQYLKVADSLIADYNALALMTNNDVSTIQSPEDTVEKPMPTIDDLQGILTLFDEDRITSISKVKSVFFSSNYLPPNDDSTIITLSFIPKDNMSNLLGIGLNVEIRVSEDNEGDFVAETKDLNNGTYERKYKVSDVAEKVSFYAYLDEALVSEIKVNIGNN